MFIMQVLVYHDLLGMMQHPHHAKVNVTSLFWPCLAIDFVTIYAKLKLYKYAPPAGYAKILQAIC